MVMKLQIFMIKKVDSNHSCLAVISLYSALNKDKETINKETIIHNYF